MPWWSRRPCSARCLSLSADGPRLPARTGPPMDRDAPRFRPESMLGGGIEAGWAGAGGASSWSVKMPKRFFWGVLAGSSFVCEPLRIDR